MSAGWYLMHRGWMESPDFQAEPFTEREAFLWSVEQAAFEPHAQWFNGVQYHVGRGEFVTSSRRMATAFRWGDKRTRLFMARMEKRQKWALRGAQEGAHGPTILTVCNYERFQTPAKQKGAANDTHEGAAGAQLGRSQGAQQKEGINNSNEGERIEEEATPRSRAPALPYDDALKAWTDAATVSGWKPLNPGLSDKRRKGLGKILSAHGLSGWVAALQRAIDSPLLNPANGHDPPGWFHFSFVTNPENFLKLSEGNYDRSFSSDRQQQRSSGWLDANAALGGGVRPPARNFDDAASGNGRLGISQSVAGAFTGQA